MGPADLYLLPAELDYRREEASAPRYRRARRRVMGRRSAQPTTRPNYSVTN